MVEDGSVFALGASLSRFAVPTRYGRRWPPNFPAGFSPWAEREPGSGTSLKASALAKISKPVEAEPERADDGVAVAWKRTFDRPTIAVRMAELRRFAYPPVTV